MTIRLFRSGSGPRGLKGDTGATGQGAFTTTVGTFTQPAAAATVAVHVVSTVWMAAGQTIFVATAGYYMVAGITNSSHVVLKNLDYPGNAVPTTVIAGGSAVSPGGVEGPAGP